MLGELVPTGGGDPIPLLKPAVMIGRRDSCDICLRFPNVSSHHCELELINDYWRVRDLGSSNGVKVNGTRVDSHWLLPGDTLTVAKHNFEIKYTPASSAPPPQQEDILAVGLMEKAGLAKRDPRRRPGDPGSTPSAGSVARPGAAGAVVPPVDLPPPAKKKPESDESIALKWLEEASEDG